MNTPHPPQTQPDAAAGDGLDDILENLANQVMVWQHLEDNEQKPPSSKLNKYIDEAKAALKAWALAEFLAALQFRSHCICDKTDDNCSTCIAVAEKDNTLDRAAANLKRRLGAEEAK